MKTASLQVHLPNLLPIIRKFLYTHQDIFLRELIANASDACQKLLTLAEKQNLPITPQELKIEIEVRPAAKQILIHDNGIGMTAEEVEKYIGQIAFSSAQEFLEKNKNAEIIGFFGMGFYSSFMVAQKVELITQSYQNTPAVKWQSDGSETYTLEETTRPQGRGTTVILHLLPEAEEFAQVWRIREIAEKYASFLSLPIFVEGSKINKKPLWREKPTDLQDQDYLSFYEKLFPTAKKPLFWVHLNVDYPFTLTGILYFPPYEPTSVVERNKIRLYVRGMFITDQLEEVVPEYLMLLHGVIESPDIPLNVSRSQLQVDATVRKLSKYITRKVADKLLEVFSNDRPRYEKLWNDLEIFIKYGMLRDEDFAQKIKQAVLLKTAQEEKLYTLEEYKALTRPTQTDKKGNLIWLYTSDPEAQALYLRGLQKQNYSILHLSSIIDPQWISYIETQESVVFRRVDADLPEKIIDKEGIHRAPALSLQEQETLLQDFERVTGVKPKIEYLDPQSPAAYFIYTEMERRLSEIFPDRAPTPVVVLNGNHGVYKRYLMTQDTRWLLQAYDWARLMADQLKGKDLETYLQREIELLQLS